MQLAPGDATRSVTLGEEDAVATTIGLEGARRGVDFAAVELEGEARGLPEAIDLVEAAAEEE